MAFDIWSSNELYRLLTDTRRDPIPAHFLDTYFTETHFSGDKDILIGELPQAGRYLAPFVTPQEQGKPIYRERGESVKALRPAYIKPKDAVRPTEAATRRISELLNGGALTLQERFDMRVADIQDFHVRAIRMTEAWMAARAFIDGQVQINYHRDQGADHPEVLVDFGRDASHTVVLAGPTYWDDPTHPILDNIQEWGDIMAASVRGGWPARMYVGRAVAKVFRTNTQIKGELDTTRRGTEVNINTGLIGYNDPMQYIGNLGAGLEVYAYSDQVQNDDDSMAEILDPKDVLLVAPGAAGVRAFGAIYDVEAIQSGQAIQTDIFPKMWSSEDPSEIFLMHQSAPLPIPLFPNRTLKATVLA